MKYFKRLCIVVIWVPAVFLIALTILICAIAYPFEYAVRYIATGKVGEGSTLIEKFINYFDD